MTPYELADISQTQFGNSISAFAVFLSVCFAYIVTAYVAGHRLTSVQASMSTIVFVAVSILLAWSMAAYVNGGVRLSNLAFSDSEGGVYAPKVWLPEFVLAICVLVIVLALKFMWDVRHPKNSDRS